jgi:nicotinamidase-related amidase
MTDLVANANGTAPTAPARDSERGGIAVIIIDMINCFDFEGADLLRPKARELVDPILALRGAADCLKVPAIYVNDNFGEWHSEKTKLVERGVRQAADVAGRLVPREQDYFVIKPQFSCFYATNLPLLLPKLGVSRLVLTGVATDICVLFSAADAHMRDYALWVPCDAVAAEDDAQADAALSIMRDHLGAETSPTSKLDLGAWAHSLDAQGIF